MDDLLTMVDPLNLKKNIYIHYFTCLDTLLFEVLYRQHLYSSLTFRYNTLSCSLVDQLKDLVKALATQILNLWIVKKFLSRMVLKDLKMEVLGL